MVSSLCDDLYLRKWGNGHQPSHGKKADSYRLLLGIKAVEASGETKSAIARHFNLLRSTGIKCFRLAAYQDVEETLKFVSKMARSMNVTRSGPY